MKVALANTLYPPDLIGGAERSVSQLAEDLSARGLQVIVLATARHGQRIDSFGSARVFRLGNPNIYWPHGSARPGVIKRLTWHLIDMVNPLIFLRALRILRREQPDILHTNNLIGLSVSVWIAARCLGIPIVHTLRDYYLMCPKSSMFKDGENCPRQCFECRVFSLPKRAASLCVGSAVGISEFILDAHIRIGFFGATSANCVIANSARVSESRLSKQRSPGPFAVGFLGRIEPEKGVEVLLEAVGRVRHLDLEVRIAGEVDDLYLNSLKQRAVDLPVRFVGHVEPNAFLDSLDVLVVPSIWREPSGRVVLEAQARGVPVIASEMGGLSELIEAGSSGLLFMAGSSGSLALELDRLISSPELWERLSSGSLKATERDAGATGEAYGELFRVMTEPGPESR